LNSELCTLPVDESLDLPPQYTNQPLIEAAHLCKADLSREPWTT